MRCARTTGLVVVLGVLLLAPAAEARSYAPTNAASFQLRAKGFARGARYTSSLERLYPRAGLLAVLSDLDQFTTPAGPGVPALSGVRLGLSVAYGFSPADATTSEWTPQGISGSSDADPGGLVGGRRIHAVSWYGKGQTAVRVSFVDVASGRYRNVLLVKPKAGGTRFDQVRGVHAGGIAWLGKYLYVADTSHGLRVFDTERIVKVPPQRAAVSPGYPLTCCRRWAPTRAPERR